MLSVVILTFNSADTIGATIASAKALSDDIHVVDSFSTDATVALAEGLGARVVQHAFENYGAQRNWAIETLALKHSWELHLDADERLTEGLAAEIGKVMADPIEAIDGYLIPRLVYFLNHPIRHGGMYPIYHLRLFRRGRGRCERRQYDQHFLVEGGTLAKLHSPMIDDIRLSLGEWVARHNRWADANVAMAYDASLRGEIQGRLAGGNAIERKRALRGAYDRMPLFLRPFLLFLYRYVIRLGFLDGKAGLIFFVLQTFWFQFLVDAKIYERRLRAPESAKTRPEERS